MFLFSKFISLKLTDNSNVAFAFWCHVQSCERLVSRKCGKRNVNRYINVNNMCLSMLEREEDDGGFALETPFTPLRKRMNKEQNASLGNLKFTYFL